MSRGENKSRPERTAGGIKEIRLPYRPHVKQNIFHSATAEVALFGGSAGPGKTTALLMDALIFVIENPGSTACLMRRTYPELESSLIKKSLEMFPREFCRYNSAKHRWTIAASPNANSYVEFVHCERTDDVFKHRSAEWQYLGIDESTSFTQEMFDQLMTRVRSSKPGVKCKVRLCTNPGQLGHCVPHGDVLTPAGWKDIRSFAVGDPVFTILPDGMLKETRVDQVHKYDYNGDMVRVCSSGLQMEMTPNHSVAKMGGVKTDKDCEKNRKFTLVPWEKLPGQAYVYRSVGWAGSNPERFILPKFIPKKAPKLIQPDSLAWNDYCEFMGWFVSEGYTVASKKRFGISQMKKKNIPIISAMLDRCGFKYKWGVPHVEIHSTKWWNYLVQFGKCRDQFVPDEIKRGSIESIRIFFNAAMAGDGHWVREGLSGSYYTISKKLADDMVEIAVKLGYLVNIKQQQRINRRGLSYTIFFKTVKNGSSELLTGNHIYGVKTSTQRRSDITRSKFSGPVYCLGIKDTHSFLIRQHGSVWISGNSWHKKYFDIGEHPPYEAWRPEKAIGDKYDPPTRCYIPATIFDNPSIIENDPTYLARLEALPEAQKRMLLFGDWAGFSGQFFAEFDRATHMIQPFTIPRHWKRFRSVDFGFDKPFSCHWHALDERGHCYTYREVYKRGLRDKEQAQLIKDASIYTDSTDPEQIEYTVGDPSQVVRGKDSGITTQQNYHDVGIPIFPGSNARAPGWMTMRNWLSIDSAVGQPYWQIFNSCPELIREIEEAVYDPNKPEDIDQRGSDHAIDEARYFLMSRPAPSQALKKDESRGKLDPNSKREWELVDKLHSDLAKDAAGQRSILHGLND